MGKSRNSGALQTDETYLGLFSGKIIVETWSLFEFPSQFHFFLVNVPVKHVGIVVPVLPQLLHVSREQ